MSRRASSFAHSTELPSEYYGSERSNFAFQTEDPLRSISSMRDFSHSETDMQSVPTRYPQSSQRYTAQVALSGESYTRGTAITEYGLTNGAVDCAPASIVSLHRMNPYESTTQQQHAAPSFPRHSLSPTVHEIDRQNLDDLAVARGQFHCPTDDPHAVYEHPHRSRLSLSSTEDHSLDRADLQDFEARSLDSSLAQRFQTSTTFEPSPTRAEQCEVTGPSIPMSSSPSWPWPADSFGGDILRRPSPYALLPALQGPSNPAPTQLDVEHSSVIPVQTPETFLRYDAEEPTDNEILTTKKKKKAKMHRCLICGKTFPRPSGLQTHMNTHNNQKPFSCAYPGCNRNFTVRSNARRHLRTHGISLDEPMADSMIPRPARANYVVNFDPPMVPEPGHELTSVVPRLRWMPSSLSSRTNAASLRSLTSEGESDLDDGEDESHISQSASELAIPLHPVVPSDAQDCTDDYEERNSYEEVGACPYHPSQYRRLPGPAVQSSLPPA